MAHPDVFLARWGLTMAMINKTSVSETSNGSVDTSVVAAKPTKSEVITASQDNDDASQASSKSKPIKLKKKIKLTKKPKTPDTKPSVADETVVPKAPESDGKPKPKVIKKLRKIKLKKPASPAVSVTSDTSSNQSTPSKKKLKLKRKKSDN